MADVYSDLQEIKNLVAELKADRAATKEKEKREAWTKYTSLYLVFVAVLAAIATQWAGKYSSRTLAQLNQATLNQAAASDQWSFYQAKSIKQTLAEESKEQLSHSNNSDPAVKKHVDTLGEKAARYDKEKAGIKEEAGKLEKKRDEARAAADDASTRGGGMGLAVSIYQIAIAIGSICLVTKKKSLWYVSIIMALLATARMVMVWLH